MGRRAKKEIRSNSQSVDILFVNLLTILRQRWPIACAVSIVVTFSLGFYLMTLTPYYTAKVTMLADLPKKVVKFEGIVNNSLAGNDIELSIHSTRMRSRSFMEKFAGALSERAIANIMKPYRAEPGHANASILSYLLENISIELRSREQLFNVEVKHRDPKIAALVANGFAQYYIQSLVSETEVSQDSANDFLFNETASTEHEVKSLQNQLQAYRQKYNLVSLEENQNIIVDRLKKINSSYADERLKRLKLEAALQKAEMDKISGINLYENKTLSDFGNLNALKKQREDVTNQIDISSKRYGPRHTVMINLHAELEALNDQINKEFALSYDALRNQYNQVQEAEQKLHNEKKIAEAEALALDKLAVEYKTIRDELSAKQSTLSRIRERLNETTVSSKLKNAYFSIVDKAIPATEPSFPNKTRTSIALVILFVFLFFIVTLIFELLDNKVKTPYDIEQVLDETLLGVIPHYRKRQLSDGLVTVEAFRSIFSQLKIASHHVGSKIVMVTSTIPEEGKSFFVNELSRTYSDHGLKTLVIDCDLRRPTQHKISNIENDRGLLQLLRSETELQEQLSSTEYKVSTISKNTHLLCSGGSTPQAHELLASSRMAELLKLLSAKYDLILIDSPPIGVFTDSLVLSHYSHEAIYVVRYGVVKRMVVRNLLSKLRNTDTEVLGVIMNKAPKRISQLQMNAGYYASKYYDYYTKES